ncbi:glycosyltransferase family 1 protein [Methylophaga sp. SB9B]|uniref:CgeB family protein n=1 Tax=Methylophaga sp. SB9B TaxID=2570356 RepID=UPI0010A935E9|nr:glycosyltransferase [Methylophaga sp. SB9B]THK41043.1 glycosyltransferase family 1 protein [Methylophaga sp. SB9B]
MSKKLLVLDGIGGIDLGRNLASSIEEKGISTKYFDMSSMRKIVLQGPRSSIAKMLNKKKDKDGFYCLPKCDFDELEKQINQFKPNKILIIGFLYKFYEPQRLKRLADRLGIELFLYDTDSCNLYSTRREFIFFIENELKIYNAIFSFSRVVTDFFKRKKLNAFFCPFGDTTKTIQPIEKSETDVIFVGSADLRRVFLLENIADKVTIYGNRWQRQWPLMSANLQQKVIDKPIWGDELQAKLTASKIVLNITRIPFYGAETGINHRIFEAMSMGCFVLTDHCDEIAELFEIGEEIETYKGIEDLKQKVDFYLTNDEERERIAIGGYQRFLKDYTWQTRAADLLTKMGLLN